MIVVNYPKVNIIGLQILIIWSMTLQMSNSWQGLIEK